MSVLAGRRVVELGVWVAGPGAAGVMADWGADVIKVEPPGGDPLRHVFRTYAGIGRPDSPPFDLDNRGKRSIELDLRDPEDRETMDLLLAGAEVFVTNLRQGALGRLGLDPERVRADHPSLVIGCISGYGREGADADRAGYDVGAYWARSGLATSTVPPGESPRPSPAGMGDHLTAMTTVAGILGALLERDRTGEGQIVDVSLLRTGVYSMGWELAQQLRHGRVAPASPRAAAPNPMWNVYEASDRRWFWLLGLESDRHWPPVARAVEREDLLGDERFADARSRRKHAEPLVAELDAAFATRPRAAWEERFRRHGVWWAPVESAAEVVEDPEVATSGALVDVPEGGGAPAHRSIATPVSFERSEVRARRGVPAVGEHSAEIRAELGLPPS